MVAGAVGEEVFVELVGETERTGLANVGEAIWAAVGFGCAGDVGFGVRGAENEFGAFGDFSRVWRWRRLVH